MISSTTAGLKLQAILNTKDELRGAGAENFQTREKSLDKSFTRLFLIQRMSAILAIRYPVVM